MQYESTKKAKKKYRENNKINLRKSSRKLWFDRKVEVLTYYGPNHKLQCSWEGCAINDPDMLSLDHINNDAKKGTVNKSGTGLYLYVKRENFPEGFQTLCHNHQWKKEIIRRRKIWEDREEA